MPAVSKSQQRLFAMVHAHNKGEFHGSRSLRRKVTELAKHISDEDARHFAETPHKGLPERKEKRAQVVLRPEDVQELYSKLQPELAAAATGLSSRSRRRRSALYNMLSGTAKGALVGTAVGGIGAGALGAGLVKRLAGDRKTPPADLRDQVAAAGIGCGLWGASRGALVGALTGLGTGALNSIRE